MFQFFIFLLKKSIYRITILAIFNRNSDLERGKAL
ncbi:hypothetical protein XENE109146_10420 [Xenorhabdus nematophila]